MRRWQAWLWVGAALGACDTPQGRTRAAEMAEAAGARTAEAARAARAWAEGLHFGELSETAKAWLRAGAEASSSGIEAVLQKGEQVAPVAIEIGRALAAATQASVTIEPIYQEVTGGVTELALRRAEVDAAIQGMTRVEVIDGLSVGFKQLASADLERDGAESAYLVMWRQHDRLVGFVFRSREGVALADLVREAPRLVALVRSVL
ncbi:MAG TPA: hypothetical protein VIK91_15530 [Nannocystis sp.]